MDAIFSPATPADSSTIPLAPEYEAEIRDRIARLDGDRTMPGTWLASSIGARSVLPPEHSHVVEAVVETKHSVMRSSVGVFGEKLHAEFTAHANTDIPALLDEIDRLRAELARRTEDVAFLERATLPELRRSIQHHQDGKQRWRTRAEKSEADNAALQKRLHDAAMTKTWTNEDGKKFVFVEDIAPALLGIEGGDQ
ncbi:hypothetical protein [Streptomyces nigrescens]